MKNFLVVYLLVGLVALGFLSACCKECRDDFSRTMEDQIAAIDLKIKDLESRSATLGAEAKAQCAKVVDNLKRLKEMVQIKLSALKNSSDDAWQDLKPSLKQAMRELEQGFEKAKSNF